MTVKSILFAVAAVLFFSPSANAQCDEMARSASAVHQCSKAGREGFQAMAKTTVASPEEDRYDVKHVKLDVALTNINTQISGSVTTTAVVTDVVMPTYVFELASNMTIDSVKIDGVLRSWTSSGVVRTVLLPLPMPQNTIFRAQVWYRGTPGGGGGFFASGLNNATSPSWGAQATWSLSQPYNAHDWWPCKQSLQDKIDSSDVWMTVANTLKAGSNGVLRAVIPVQGGRSRYEWRHRYPIDYYLVSVATAPYIDYSFYVTFPNSTDSMLVQNYVYTNPATLNFWKTRIDSTAQMIQHFSELFGRYPFWQEKYGHCMAPLSGGMEHQTMTTQGNFNTELTVHELGHQWFGDAVTCGTWSDIWLNEGFASYCEYLFRERFQTPASARAKMQDVHDDVMSVATGTVYSPDTTDENRLFSSRLTYNKGSAVVHTLRFHVGNDTTFFSMLRLYQQQYAFKTATTEEFKRLAENYLGYDLDTFFDQWVYGEGYPRFSATWNQNGQDVVLRLSQTNANPGATPFFSTPLQVRLTSSAGDTTVRVYMNAATQTFEFPWTKAMTGLSFDPNNWLMNTVGTVSKDPSLVSVEGIGGAQAFTVHPNPTRDAWMVGGLQSGASLLLTDLAGRAIWQGSGGAQAAVVPAALLPAGVYILRVQAAGGAAQSVRLVKQ